MIAPMLWPDLVAAVLDLDCGTLNDNLTGAMGLDPRTTA